MAYDVNKFKRAAAAAADFQELKDAGIKVKVTNTPANPDDEDAFDCSKLITVVPFAQILRNFVCTQLTNRMDMQKMEFEGIDEEKLGMLENQFIDNRFEEVKQTLGNERICEGTAALVITPYVIEGKRKLFIEAADLKQQPEYIFGKLVYCVTQSLGRYKHTTGYGYLQSEYSLKNGKCIVKTEGIDEETGKPIRQKYWNVKWEEKRVLNVPFIPVTEFKNNWAGTPEFIGYLELMDAIERTFNIIQREAIASKTILTLNTLLLNGDADKIISGIIKGDMFVKIVQADASFGSAVSAISTTGKIAEFQALLDSQMSTLWKMMSMPTDFDSEGKNNKHNDEIAQSTAASRVNIEAKRNLVHQSYKEFMKKLFRMNMYFGTIPFTTEEIETFELNWSDSIDEAQLKDDNKEDEVANGSGTPNEEK